MVYLNATIYLNFIKDIKMNKIISNHSLQSKLWITLLVSAMGLSACSNEVEEKPASTNTTEAESVETGTTDTADNTVIDEMTDGSVIGDSTMVDENNTSFNQKPTESDK